MSSIEAHLPILQVLVPLFGALVSAFFRRGVFAWAVALVVSWACFFISAWLLVKVMQTGQTLSYVMGGWSVPQGIEYRIDVLNAFVLVLVTSVGAVVMLYAKRSVAHEVDTHRQAWFYTMYLLCLTGLLGITVTGDAFNVFVFLEVSSLATYVLIALGRHRRGLLASYQYLIVGTIGATFYVIGIGLLYVVTGSLNLGDIAERLGPASADYSRPILAGLAFLTVGICLKLALFPMHVWLPNAYAYAPSVATAFLAGTATKVAVYLLLRIYFTLFGKAFTFAQLHVAEVLLVLSVAAMFLASFSSVFEQHAKRMLAYSSVAQIGYITLGISIANQLALAGGIVHLFNHAVTKAALFLAMGAVFYRTGTLRIDDFAGLGRKMPLTMAAFVIGGLSIIGVPGTAGFVSKWYLAIGALEKGYWPLVFVIMLSSLIAVVYIGRIVEAAYFREATDRVASVREAPASMLVPLWILTAATVYLGIDTRATADVALSAAKMLLGGGR
ncbi:MAG: monovalent cation/H+ antiporter subunit D family protein [Hyphomicrobiaceae bacterium]|nr:monovalent cation/H+ antiporter subunit D family protein [Hyphomicrobiaceae bacterium]